MTSRYFWLQIARAPGPLEGREVGRPAWRRLASGIAWLAGVLLTAFAAARLLQWFGATVLTLLLSSIGTAQQASLAVFSAGEQSEILKVAEAYRSGVLKRDTAAVIALYREDAVEMPFFRAPVKGRGAIADFYQGQFSAPPEVRAFTFEHGETTVAGDVAYDVGSYRRTMAGSPAGPVEATGSYAVILKRTGSQWKIAYVIYTCNCAPPGPTSSAAAR